MTLMNRESFCRLSAAYTVTNNNGYFVEGIE